MVNVCLCLSTRYALLLNGRTTSLCFTSASCKLKFILWECLKPTISLSLQLTSAHVYFLFHYSFSIVYIIFMQTWRNVLDYLHSFHLFFLFHIVHSSSPPALNLDGHKKFIEIKFSCWESFPYICTLSTLYNVLGSSSECAFLFVSESVVFAY